MLQYAQIELTVLFDAVMGQSDCMPTQASIPKLPQSVLVISVNIAR